jgi:penicillin amidase
LPQSYNPPSGWIATANNDITPAGYRPFIAARWEEPYRIRRIVELLEGKTDQTVARMAAMQLDTLSLAARDLLPPMLAAARAGGSPNQELLDLLDRWDFRVTRDRPEPLIFLTWLREAARRIFADEMGGLFFDYWSWNLDQVVSVLTDDAPAAAVWCDDIATETVEVCSDQVTVALDDARAALAAAYGADPADWRWGTAHQASFPHPVLSHVPILGEWLAVPIETDGDNYTINRGTPRIPSAGVRFPDVHGPGLRAIFDFADLDRSRFVIAGGQSGNPLSPHYGDLIRRWRDGAFLTMAGEADRVLQLLPEGR